MALRLCDQALRLCSAKAKPLGTSLRYFLGAHLDEPWATTEQVDRGVMHEVPNQNADPAVAALIDLAGLNDLLKWPKKQCIG